MSPLWDARVVNLDVPFTLSWTVELILMAPSKIGSGSLARSSATNQMLVDKMKPELRGKLDAIRQLLTESDAKEATARYEVGRLVLDVQKDPQKYGKEGVKLLSRTMSRGKDFLYDCARVARTWSKSEFDALLEREGKGGMRLSFSHLVELSREGQMDRDAYVGEVLGEGLSVHKTRRLVDAGRRGGGVQERPKAVPHHRVLTELVAQAEAAPNEKEVDAALVGLMEGSVTQELEMLLKRATEAQRNAVARYTYMAQRLEAARERVLEKLAAQARHGDSQQARPQGNVQDPSRPALDSDFLDVPKIDGTAIAPSEAPVVEQGA